MSVRVSLTKAATRLARKGHPWFFGDDVGYCTSYLQFSRQSLSENGQDNGTSNRVTIGYKIAEY